VHRCVHLTTGNRSRSIANAAQEGDRDGLVLIASVYIGFAVADGRRGVLAVESSVAAAFVVVAAAPWPARTSTISSPGRGRKMAGPLGSGAGDSVVRAGLGTHVAGRRDAR
jgi:hypothetical protein